VEEGEEESARNLWESQLDDLKRVLGAWLARLISL
jgi:hypothetical protein